MSYVSQTDRNSQIINKYQNGLSACNVGNEFGISQRQVLRILTKSGINRRICTAKNRTHHFNYHFFDLWSPSMAYWLGFLCADGTIKRNGRWMNNRSIDIRLKRKDAEHLQKFQNTICSNYKITFRKRKSGYGTGKFYARLIVNSGYLVNQLDRLGFTDFKHGDARPMIKNIPNNMFNHWLRGMTDGDGWVSNSRYPVWGLTDKYYSVMVTIINRLRTIVPGHYNVVPNNSAFKILLSRKKAIAVLNYVYDCCTVMTSLDRKRMIYETL